MKMQIKTIVIGIMIIISTAVLGCSETSKPNITESDIPNVFFTSEVSSAGLVAVYEALNATPTGKVAIKVHSGEPGNQNFIRPEFMAELVKKVDGTFIETNVAYHSQRATTANHMRVAQQHGWTAVAPFVVLDGEGEVSFPVEGGKHLKENLVGSRFDEFGYHIVLSHFKGHAMGGFGGALKNTSIGYASARGKGNIHTHGKGGTNIFAGDQVSFLEAMAEAAKTITDRAQGRILFINVMNNISIDCDCDGGASAPVMADIGILASYDPVALDQACIDLVYKAHDKHKLVERIESRHGLRTVEYAEEIGIGSRKYKLVKI